MKIVIIGCSLYTNDIMSTYVFCFIQLVAFAVGEFDYVARPIKHQNSSPIICRLKGDSKQGQFALDVAVTTMEFYSGYFDVAYPLPKLDMIAVPDFRN